MTDARRLIEELARQEKELYRRTFLAPCVRGGQVRTRLAGLIHTFTANPANREGWGIFHPRDAVTADWITVAEPEQIAAYLGLLPAMRWYLALRLRGRTWLAYPFNEGDARQRLGRCQPMPVHLVERGQALEGVIARWDGTAFWFDALDRRADPQLADQARESLRAFRSPETLRLPGLTPELRVAYTLALKGTAGYRARRTAHDDRERLRRALDMAGGRLRDYREHDDYWLVEWLSAKGERHTSAIAKRDLTVISAGICLDGEDRRFDLQSLVGVMEQRPDWM
ncbi:MAG: hypothetical protein H6970_00975 [Gammaproteobacteria bacterium]|nr:hypothetical protein [Gammaproteobacteria bacterium]MCP5423630.1 hypothetical protein [Gammaproteobacteria bacterium]